jgi:hypothetical protein
VDREPVEIDLDAEEDCITVSYHKETPSPPWETLTSLRLEVEGDTIGVKGSMSPPREVSKGMAGPIRGLISGWGREGRTKGAMTEHIKCDLIP